MMMMKTIIKLMPWRPVNHDDENDDDGDDENNQGPANTLTTSRRTQ